MSDSYSSMPDPYGEEGPFRPLEDKPLAQCIWCRKLYDVAGFSAAAERFEYECSRCAYVVGEVALGRMCAKCERVKENGERCCP